MLPAKSSVNQSAPSGPAVMEAGPLEGVGIGNSLKLPPVVTRPIWLARSSLNQSAPSGPAVMKRGRLESVGTGYSVIAGEAVAGRASSARSATSDPSVATPLRV